MNALQTFPAALRAWIGSVDPSLHRTRAKDGRLALVEHAWHLADLEVEGYGLRLTRILEGDEPLLPDFQGDVLAEQRRYLELELEPALERFSSARAENVALLDSLTAQQWDRAGHQEGVGRVTIRGIAEMMRVHDGEHANNVRVLLGELGQP